MIADLHPASTYVLAAKSSWIQTLLNHSCSGPANYHMMFGPCIQTSIDMAVILQLNCVLHCKQKLMNSNVQANWVLWLRQCFKQVMWCSVKPVTFQITMGIIQCCCLLFYPTNSAEMVYYVIIKWFALVIMDSRWYPIAVEPSVYQGFGHCFCLLIRYYDCHCKIRESIGHQQRHSPFHRYCSPLLWNSNKVYLRGNWLLMTLFHIWPIVWTLV